MVSQAKFLSVFFLGFLLFLFSATFSLAQGTPQPEITVDHVAGNVEKIGEKIGLFLKFNKKDKALYHKRLAEKRLAEVYFVVKSEKIDLVEPTASRYTTYLGRLNEYVMSKDVKEVKEDLLKMYQKHKEIITDFQKKFEFDSGWWLALQHGVNSTSDFSEKLKGL